MGVQKTTSDYLFVTNLVPTALNSESPRTVGIAHFRLWMLTKKSKSQIVFTYIKMIFRTK